MPLVLLLPLVLVGLLLAVHSLIPVLVLALPRGHLLVPPTLQTAAPSKARVVTAKSRRKKVLAIGVKMELIIRLGKSDAIVFPNFYKVSRTV